MGGYMKESFLCVEGRREERVIRKDGTLEGELA